MYSSEYLIKFDFSDVLFRECNIDNYQAFWQCTFNNNTYFVNSYLLNLEFESNKKIPIPKDNFQNCKTDTKFSIAFKKDNNNNININIQVNDFVLEFFGLFYSRGMLQGVTFVNSKKGRDHYPSLSSLYSKMALKILTFDEIVDFSKREGVLEFYEEYGEKKIRVVNGYKSDILKFIKDGAMSKNINDLILKISSILHC